MNYVAQNFLLQKQGGGQFIISFLFHFCFVSNVVTAQDICPGPPSCGNMWLEIVRQSPGNVTATCPLSALDCTDQFRQVAYKVYLRIKKNVSPNDPNGLNDFNLDYKNVDVIVRLKNQNTPFQFSHIDEVATTDCYTDGAGANWFNFSSNSGDKAIFTLTPNQASISFANLLAGNDPCGSNGPNNSDNIITFKHGTPTNADGCPPGGLFQRCFYAEMFTVVVNAYPGELIGFEFDVNGRGYEPYSSPGFCTLPVSNTGAQNGLGNIMVTSPDTYISTTNESLEVQLLDEEATSDGGYDFPVAVTNTGTHTRTITYLEFMLKATLTQMDRPFDITGDFLPEGYMGSVNPQSNQSDRYLHYIINTPIVLMPNETKELSRIKMGPPILLNQSWATSLDFDGAATKPRIKTSGAGGTCTLLKTSGGPRVTTSFGDGPCNDPNIHFRVRGEPGTCGEIKAVVELYSTNPPTTINLKELEFRLQFDFVAPDVTFQGIDDTNWPMLICSSSGCFTPGFCHKISADGKTFDYCFSVPDNAPTTFNLTANDPSRTLELNFAGTNMGCITNVEVTTLAMTYAFSPSNCIPVIDPPLGFTVCPTDAIRGTVKTELGEGIDEVTIQLLDGIVNTGVDEIPDCASVTCNPSCNPPITNPITPPISVLTDANGYYGFCDVCSGCDYFKVEPVKNDNPLNGVTTYDLVLISKHASGALPLDSPYKVIAADADKSKSVTTFDIALLRRLILGIISELPGNTSWRFINVGHFAPNSNPANPFNPLFPEFQNCIAPLASAVDFIGIKVGDVNNSAVANRPASFRPSTNLSWPALRASTGSYVTVPITYSGKGPLEAIQLGFRFDPKVLQLVSPSQGDIESYLTDNFNLLRASEGEIKTLWLPITSIPEAITPGTVLFNLTFKVLSEIPEAGDLPLWLDEQLLTCSAWDSEGNEYALQQSQKDYIRLRDSDSPNSLRASVRPNPGVGIQTLFVQTDKPENARLMLFDAFGRRIALRECTLVEGGQEIPLPEATLLPAGVYVWKIYTPTQEAQGHLIKQ